MRSGDRNREGSAPENKIRVVYLTDKLAYGGTPLQIVELATQLDRQHFRAYFLALSCVDAALREHLRLQGVEIESAGCANWVHPRALPALARLTEHLRRWRPHILHAFLTTANVLGASVGKILRIPVCITSHRDLGGFDGTWMVRLNNWCDRRLSNAVVTNSFAVRDAVAARTGLPPAAIHVVHNGIALSPQVGQSDRRLIREQLELDFDAPVAAMVANLRLAKGHHIAVAAFETIARRLPSARLVICGYDSDPAYAQRVREQVRQAGLTEHIRFLGSRRDVPQLLQAVDVLLAPSLSEGFSNAILEAMAAGVPVVASAVGGNVEQVSDGECGFLVPRADATNLADRLIFLFTHPSQCRIMGQKARLRAGRLFSRERAVRAYQSLYCDLLAQRSNSVPGVVPA